MTEPYADGKTKARILQQMSQTPKSRENEENISWLDWSPGQIDGILEKSNRKLLYKTAMYQNYINKTTCIVFST